jgi:3-hydroxybutyryl-CoA dehydrogenase
MVFTQGNDGNRWFALPPEGDDEAGGETIAITRLAIIGGGQMGAGIAEVCARAGVEVTLIEVDREAVAAARGRLEAGLERAVRGGKADGQEAHAALARVDVTSDWGALDGADAAIEAVVEAEHEKRLVFGELDRRLPSAMFLASNTSSVPIMKLASATGRPDRVLGLHFFNPVAVMDLVEVVTSLTTSERTSAIAQEFVRGVLGKTAIRAPDRAGFVVNALLIPFILCAIRMLDAGSAARDEIDQGMVKGCHHPMGPLALADLIGLDTVLAVSESLYAEFHDPVSSAPPRLRRMVEAGMLGRKTGQGFYSYQTTTRRLTGTAS